MSDSRTFTAQDAWSFNGGTHVSAYDVMGAHLASDGNVVFRVWAPEARAVHVVGDMNGWTETPDSALTSDPSGVWRGSVAAEVVVTIADGAYADSAEEWASLHVPATDSAQTEAPTSVS